jgi:hypothetical protein
MQRTILMFTGLLFVASTSVGELVYDNSTTDLDTRFSVGNNLVGDEIILGGAGRRITTFSFQYYGLTLSGNETAQVRFFANDGTEWLGPGQSGAFRPSTLLYDSGSFSIVPTNRATLNFDLTLDNVVVPDNFTWTVEFAGVEAGENVGLDLYSPPTVGDSLSDFWFFEAGAWELRTNATTAMNFGARFEAVPEPSVWALCIVGGICGFFLVNRRSRK